MMGTNFLKQIDIRLYAALISIILSCLAYLNSGPINYDGIFYLSVADIYLKQGFHAAMALYPWPFYSVFIAWLSEFSHLSLLHAAEFFNTLCFALLPVVFMTIGKELGGDRTTQFFAGLIILLHPQINDYRSFVVRDFAYWFFCLLGLWQLIRFNQTKKWTHSILWFFSLGIATLFRIEGSLVLVLTPLALLFQRQPWRDYLSTLSKIYVFPLLAIFIFLYGYLFHPALAIHNFGRLTEIGNTLQSLYGTLAANIHEKLDQIGQTILDPKLNHDTTAWFIFGFSGDFIWQIITTLNPFYFLLVAYALWKKLLPANLNKKIILYGFLAINFLIPLFFYAKNFYLSDRYLMLFILTLLLFVPLSLHRLYQPEINSAALQHTIFHAPRLFVFTLLILLAYGVGSMMHFGYSKAYITEAGLWLRQNTPEKTTIFSNNRQILFYAERTPINWNMAYQNNYNDDQPLKTVQEGVWKKSDYLALRIKHEALADKEKILSLLGKKPIKIFNNKRGDQVLIFKL